MSDTNFTDTTDENLFQLCRTYGARALEWRNKFIGLLPEVNRRRLYEKKGFSTITEFAAKLAGVSKDQLGTVLNLDRKFEDKPLLKKLLVTGEVSINKLARVAAIVTTANEELLATQVKLLSKSALETFVRDEKNFEKNANQDVNKSINRQEEFQCQDGLFEVQNLGNRLPGQSVASPAESVASLVNILNLSEEVKVKLLELQQKGINLNELLLEFLEKREQAIAEEKEQITKEMSEKAINFTTDELQTEPMNISTPNHPKCKNPSRYIPVKVRRILTKEYGDKCSIPTCQKPQEQTHHTQRFALVAKAAPALVNNPHYLAPLCKNHHQIAHTIDLKFQQVRQKVLC